MAAPFAARSDQPVSRRNLEQSRPIGALAGRGEFLGPELIQAQLPPEIAGQPAGTVLAWTAQLIILQAQGQGWRVRGGRRAVGGKEAAGFGLARIGVENIQSFGPGGMLGVVEIAQVKEGFLMHWAGGMTDAFDHAPVAMFLAIFFSFGRAQKHVAMMMPQNGRGSARG